MRRALTIAMLACAASTADQAKACGEERWPVKTLADPRAQEVLNAPAQTVLLAELLVKDAPDRKALQAAEQTRFPDELVRYTTLAMVVGYKLEADGDYHIVLEDPASLITGSKRTIIAEIPDPACVPKELALTFAGLRARFEQTFGKPSAKFHKLSQPVRVHVTGVGFFDFLHGQTGVAPNGFELHPLLDFTVPPARPAVQPGNAASASTWSNAFFTIGCFDGRTWWWEFGHTCHRDPADRAIAQIPPAVTQ